MSDADDERIMADMRRRIGWRALLNVLVSCAVVVTEFGLIVGLHMITRPPQWRQIASVTALAALVGAVGMTAAWWVTRLPPEALSARITLRNSERFQRFVSRLYLFYPIVLGLFAFDSALLVHRALSGGWRTLDVTGGLTFTLGAVSYVLLLTGWGAGRRGRLIYDEELFRSFRTRGYIAGFWSIMAGLALTLALGLARPAWAVEALPVLIAVGISVPALTIGLLSRRAEPDA